MDYKTGNPGLNSNTFEGVARPAEGEPRMTLQGTVNKSFLMFVVLLLAALWPWARFFAAGGDVAAVAVPATVGVVGGFVLSLIIIFKQTSAPYLSLPYAALEGLAVGAVSALAERRYPGIAINAVELTFGVFVVLLFAYGAGLIRVTEHFKAMVIGATGAVAVIYLIDFVAGFFGVHVPLLNDAGTGGIVVSLVVVVIAALNLVMDFDFIQTGVERGAPRYMEWYGAFGLMVTLVWLYLEILRLLGKSRR